VSTLLLLLLLLQSLAFAQHSWHAWVLLKIACCSGYADSLTGSSIQPLLAGENHSAAAIGWIQPWLLVIFCEVPL
jgi:hypothetical protein